MKILVVGGSGNISNEITEGLLNEGHEVITINRGIRKKRENAIICDIKNKNEYYEKVKDMNFDCVIDMLCYHMEDAVFDYETYKSRTKHLIVCSSVAAYKRPFTDIPISSDTELLDNDSFPYGFRKANIERYFVSKMDDMNITIIRPSLTFGVGCKNIGILRQNYNIIDRIINNKPLISFGDGLNPWTFSFSPDVAQAFIKSVLNEKTYGKQYHVTSGFFAYFDDLYKEIANYLGKNVIIYHLSTELLYEYSKELFGHIYLEKAHLGYFSIKEFIKDVPSYKPVYNLKKGVRLIVDYLMQEKHIDIEKENIEDDLCNRYERIKEGMTI